MNIFKSIVVTATTVATLALGLLTNTASAGCMPNISCNGNPVLDSVTIGGVARHQGFGGAAFEGMQGNNDVILLGSDRVNTTLNIGGNVCGPTCQNGTFTFEGSANQGVITSSRSWGGQSNQPVTSQTEGIAASNILFEFGKSGF
jgi:hypothetical protein